MSGEEQVREWRDVCGWGGMYVGVYQVSNDGCVRRVKTGWVLKQNDNGNGYRVVGLHVNNKRSNRRIHRLVAEAFIENPDNKPDVDHVDRNKLNNHVTNLRWATRSENCINRAGRSNTGMKHICRTRHEGKPGFRVAIERGRKNVVSKYFPIKDRDEADVMAEAVAYRNEKYAELGEQVDDRPAVGNETGGGGGTGQSR
jgi:hypothetical protein